jgi:prevent-host-death family protein
MRIAPLADVKARLSAYLDECRAHGPIVITRNGKAAAVLLVPSDEDDLERLPRAVT